MILKLTSITIVINSKCSNSDDADNKNVKDFWGFFNNQFFIISSNLMEMQLIPHFYLVIKQ